MQAFYASFLPYRPHTILKVNGWNPNLDILLLIDLIYLFGALFQFKQRTVQCNGLEEIPSWIFQSPWNLKKGSKWAHEMVMDLVFWISCRNLTHCPPISKCDSVHTADAVHLLANATGIHICVEDKFPPDDNAKFPLHDEDTFQPDDEARVSLVSLSFAHVKDQFINIAWWAIKAGAHNIKVTMPIALSQMD